MSNETKNLEALSKPVMFIESAEKLKAEAGLTVLAQPIKRWGADIPLYSQEYVNALQQRIAELGREKGYVSELTAEYQKSQDALKSVTELWNEQRQRIAEYERILDGLPAVAIVGGWTARGIIEYAKSLEQRIAELEPIKESAEKLVRCKGRYHSEQNYRALAALFGVTTPDLPPVEGGA